MEEMQTSEKPNKAERRSNILASSFLPPQLPGAVLPIAPTSLETRWPGVSGIFALPWPAL